MNSEQYRLVVERRQALEARLSHALKNNASDSTVATIEAELCAVHDLSNHLRPPPTSSFLVVGLILLLSFSIIGLGLIFHLPEIEVQMEAQASSLTFSSSQLGSEYPQFTNSRAFSVSELKLSKEGGTTEYYAMTGKLVSLAVDPQTTVHMSAEDSGCYALTVLESSHAQIQPRLKITVIRSSKNGETLEKFARLPVPDLLLANPGHTLRFCAKPSVHFFLLGRVTSLDFTRNHGGSVPALVSSTLVSGKMDIAETGKLSR